MKVDNVRIDEVVGAGDTSQLETDRRRSEIAELVRRGELTELERVEHIEEWVRLTLQAQCESTDEALHGKRSAIRAASQELGIDRASVSRALKVAESLTAEAKAAARDFGLADDTPTLLQVANSPREQQVQALRDVKIAAEKANNEARAIGQDEVWAILQERTPDVPDEGDIWNRAYEEDIRREARHQVYAWVRVYEADQLETFLDEFSKAMKGAINAIRKDESDAAGAPAGEPQLTIVRSPVR